MAATGALTVLSMRGLLWLTAHDTLPITLWVAVCVAILPPSILMGAGFPLGMTIAMRVQTGVRRMAEQVGKVYASNVAGAIAGSLITGFELLPWLGSRQSLILLAALFIAGGLVMATRLHPARRLPILLGLVIITGAAVSRFPDPFKVAIDRRYGDLLPEFWRHESAQSAVSVRATTLRHTLYINGLHQANDHPEMVKVHRVIGHLPMVLHGHAKDVLVVGLGGGATPGAVSQYDGATVQVVELSEGVRRAAALFAHVNYDVVNRPNVRIRVDDGRNFMRRVEGRFDVITADLIQPGHAGAGLVYSREYFELARRALKDDGVMLQWIGHRPFVEYALIMRTFLSVFPEATLWYDGTLMAGTRHKFTLDLGVIDRLRQSTTTAEALASVDLRSFEDLRNWYTGGADEMRRYVGDGPLLTDDRPLMEYRNWLPAPDRQPPLNIAALKGDVARVLP